MEDTQPLTVSDIPLPTLPAGGRFRAPFEDCQISATNDVEAVTAWLRERARRSTSTYANYRKEVERLMLWAASRNQALSDLASDDMVDFDLFLANPSPRDKWIGPRKPRPDPAWRPFVGPLSRASREQAFNVLRSLYAYLHTKGYLRRNPFGGSSIGREKQNTDEAREMRARDRYLSRDAWEFLLAYVEALPREDTRARQHAARIRWILNLLYETGARRGEIAAGSMSDLHRDEKDRRWLRLIGKGAKPRDVPVSDDLFDELMRYRLEMKLPAIPTKDEETPLVLSIAGRSRITDKMILRIVKEICLKASEALKATDPERAARLEKASVHWIRHTQATHRANDGVDIKILQEHLGHADISTTMIYRHIDRGQLHDAITRKKHGK